MTREEINKIPVISFQKKIKKFKKPTHLYKIKKQLKKKKNEEKISSSSSESFQKNEPTAYK